MLTDNNKIFRNWFVITHRHLAKVSAQIIQCIIFGRNELCRTLYTPRCMDQGSLTVNYRYTHREFQLKPKDSFKIPVTSYAGENVNKRRQIEYARRWEGVIFCHKWTIVYEMYEIGRAHVWTPVTPRNLVCRLLLEKKNTILFIIVHTTTLHEIFSNFILVFF